MWWCRFKSHRRSLLLFRTRTLVRAVSRPFRTGLVAGPMDWCRSPKGGTSIMFHMFV